MVISNLTANMRLQAKVAGYRERRARSLYAMTKALITIRVEEEVIRIAVQHIGTEFESQTALLLPDGDGRIGRPAGPLPSQALLESDLSVAQWVYDHGQEAGRGTDTLAGSRATYFPIQGSAGVIGVLAIVAPSLRRIFVPEQRRLLEAFMTLFAEALERVRLAKKAQSTQVRMETESLRNALLSAISHDLRTPLATIVGASSSLVEDTGQLNAAAKEELSRTIYEEAQRMASLSNRRRVRKGSSRPPPTARTWSSWIWASRTWMGWRWSNASGNGRLSPSSSSPRGAWRRRRSRPWMPGPTTT